MLIAIVVALCVLLAMLGFLLPRLSDRAKRGTDKGFAAGQRAGSSAAASSCRSGKELSSRRLPPYALGSSGGGNHRRVEARERGIAVEAAMGDRDLDEPAIAGPARQERPARVAEAGRGFVR